LYDDFILGEDVLIPCQLRRKAIQMLHNEGVTWEEIFAYLYPARLAVIE